MHFVDRALARRLESAEEMPQVHHAEWCQKNQPKVGAAVEEISGGHDLCRTWIAHRTRRGHGIRRARHGR